MAKKDSRVDKIIDLFFGIFALIAIYLFLQKMYFALTVFFVIAFGLRIVRISYVRKRKKNFFKDKSTLEKIRNLTPVQFEDFVCDLFNRLGYKTERIGGPNDDGIDVVATKDGAKHYIQCKKYITSQVGVGAMRDFYGALVDKLSKNKAYFITTNIFTLDAEKFAEGKSIELVDGNKLMEYVKLSGINVVTPTAPKCPHCEIKMILRTARKGPRQGEHFFGCANYPDCTFTKNIEK
jgi:restriction system protein